MLPRVTRQPPSTHLFAPFFTNGDASVTPRSPLLSLALYLKLPLIHLLAQTSAPDLYCSALSQPLLLSGITDTPFSMSHSRKRSAPDGRDAEEALPWWEVDRRGSGGGRNESGLRNDARRQDRGREREYGRDRGRRDEYGQGHGRGGYRREEGRRPPYALPNAQHQPPSSSLEEGEIPLPYDAPSLPPNAPPSAAPVTPAPISTPAEADFELDLSPQAELDPEAILAERRRKRAEILAKYSGIGSGQAGTPEGGATPSSAPTPGRQEMERDAKRLRIGTDSPAPAPSALLSNLGTPDPEPNHDFSLAKDADSPTRDPSSTHTEEEISAADYNPDEDRKEDDRRMKMLERREEQFEVVQIEDVGSEQEEEEDDDDMFSIGTKPVKAKKIQNGGNQFVPVINRSLDSSANLTDNYDDAEGYYKLLLGELLDNGRYHVHAFLGKGMFSSVVRAKDTVEDKEVAVKVIRSQESMYKAGVKEANILRKLMEADPTDKKHVIRLLRTFDHRGHLCLVFESLSMNLREVVKRFGKDVGINLRAVRAYASQMFLGLSLLKKCDIMHADIKPDNILVNESKSVLKICDLGSASDVSENDITPYLVSRFYRAPEIILGLPYDPSLDVWSIGCTLYELYTGKILFPGRTNNHMLQLIMELKGKMQHKALKKAKFVDQHFDESMNFLSVDKNDSVKAISIPSKAANDLKNRLMPSSAVKKMKEDEARLLGHFVDLLDKMLSLDATKRPTPKDLLNHPFIRG